MVQLVRHRQTKESATDRLNLNHRVTPRLHRSQFKWTVCASVYQALAKKFVVRMTDIG